MAFLSIVLYDACLHVSNVFICDFLMCQFILFVFMNNDTAYCSRHVSKLDEFVSCEKGATARSADKTSYD